MTAAPASVSSGFSDLSDRDRQLLFRQILAGFAVLMFAVIRTAPPGDDTGLVVGCVICVLAIIPTLKWARQMPYNYPFFEIFMATNLTSYGIPLIWEHKSVELFPAGVQSTAAHTVILFQVVAMAVFYGTKLRSKETRFWSAPLFATTSPKWLHTGMAVTTTYLIISSYFWTPPADITGVLRAITAGMATASTFMLCVLWGRGELAGMDKILLVLMLAAQAAIWSASLVLRQGASLILLGLVGYFFGRRRVPWIPLLASFALFAVLNIGKYHMRAEYWFESGKRAPALTELGGFYADWFAAGLQPRAEEQDVSRSGVLIERTSLIQMLCLVAALSPEPKPFLRGETYWHTLGQFIPRYLWPSKPRGHLSTYTLAIYYGLQSEEATHSTTIAFGFLPEAYANFGYVGAVVLAIVFGVAFKFCAVRSRNSPVLSYGGILVVMLTAWSYQTELTMSIWITSLFQALAATIGIIWLPRQILQSDAK